MLAKQPASLGGFEFDAIIKRSETMTCDVPEYATEEGYSITDNICLKPRELEIEAIITNASKRKAKKGIEVTYVLNGHIQVDDYVKIDSKSYKGNYRASKIKFTGDTEGDDWKCVALFVEVK